MPIISNKKSNVAADNNIDEEEALPLFVLDDEELDQDTKDVLDARITPMLEEQTIRNQTSSWVN